MREHQSRVSKCIATGWRTSSIVTHDAIIGQHALPLGSPEDTVAGILLDVAERCCSGCIKKGNVSDTQIQKMGRWRGKTFKEYIREELACYFAGMSTAMKRRFGFVNIAAGSFVDITDSTIITDYNVNTKACDEAR
mmetsp:Transcript_6646/g.14502  ORF Transcript_6646/g.14502 Transcript_6646/m.14502 type:complete len:136 (+) Transcript_6646:437-844(+)